MLPLAESEKNHFTWIYKDIQVTVTMELFDSISGQIYITTIPPKYPTPPPYTHREILQAECVWFFLFFLFCFFKKPTKESAFNRARQLPRATNPARADQPRQNGFESEVLELSEKSQPLILRE